MKLHMNNKLTAVALSVAALTCGLGISGTAQATMGDNNTNQFTSTVLVKSDNVCTLNVTPPDSKTFAATWTGSITSSVSNLAFTSSASPSYITVSAEGGANCTVNQARLITTTSALKLSNFYSSSVSSGGGAWGMVPIIADVKLYNDTAATSQSTDKVVVTSGQGKTFTPSETVDTAQGTVITKDAKEYYGQSMVVATDTYIPPSAFSSLMEYSPGNGTGVVSFTGANGIKYKSVKFGISALFSADPVNAKGEVDKASVADGDRLTSTFTVTVTEA